MLCKSKLVLSMCSLAADLQRGEQSAALTEQVGQSTEMENIAADFKLANLIWFSCAAGCVRKFPNRFSTDVSPADQPPKLASTV